MTLGWIHPGLVLVLGAWLLPLLRGRIKRAAMVLLPVAALVLCLTSSPGTHGVVRVLGQELVLGRVDATSQVFALVFALMACIGMVFALHVEDDSRHIAALTYAGSALGVTFAGDLLTLYVFWELMAVASTLLVWQRREPSAVAAGFRYLLVHVVGGLALLAGYLESALLRRRRTHDPEVLSYFGDDLPRQQIESWLQAVGADRLVDRIAEHLGPRRRS